MMYNAELHQSAVTWWEEEIERLTTNLNTAEAVLEVLQNKSTAELEANLATEVALNKQLKKLIAKLNKRIARMEEDYD
jgi:multidrug resistance efflux pump